jgi:hypothetical protein
VLASEGETRPWLHLKYNRDRSALAPRSRPLQRHLNAQVTAISPLWDSSATDTDPLRWASLQAQLVDGADPHAPTPNPGLTYWDDEGSEDGEEGLIHKASYEPAHTAPPQLPPGPLDLTLASRRWSII